MSNKKLFLVILLLNIANVLLSQTIDIKGFIGQGKNNDPLIGANIFIEASNKGCSSNNQAYYVIKNIKAGKYKISISYSGYKSINTEIIVSKTSNKFDFNLEKSDNKLNEIVITGTGTRHSLKNTPIKTELFLKNQIQAQASRSIEDLLNNLSPSIDFSPNKMGSRMKINGLGNEYILVLIDGKRLHGDVGGLNDLSRINTLDIEKIELIKGSSSALYGSEAMAGLINIITKKNNNNLFIENSTNLATYGDLQQYNSIDFRINNFSSKTKATIKRTDGWQNSNLRWERDKDNKDKKKLEKTYAKSINESSDFEISQIFTYKLNTKTKAYIDGSFYKKDIEQDRRYKAYGFFYDNKSLEVGSEHIFNKNSKLYFNSTYDNYKYYNKYSYKYVSKHIDEAGRKELVTHQKSEKSLNSEQIRYSTKLNGTFKINSSNMLNTGIEYTKKTLEAPYRLQSNNVSDYTYSAYIQDEISLIQNIKLVSGLRYIKHKEFGSILTPKLAILWKTSNTNIRANYSSGYKTPTLKELYMRYETSGMGSHNLYIGNKNLKAQKSNYLSLSTEYNRSNISLSLSIYNNAISDMIALKIIDTKAIDEDNGIEKTKKYYNISKARSRGFDIILNTKLSKNISVNTSYSYVDARDTKSNIYLDGTSHHYGNINCTWTKYMKNSKSLCVNVSGRIQSKKFYDEKIETIEKTISGNTEAYNIYNINLSHKFARYKNFNFIANINLKNIFNYIDDSPLGQNHASMNPGRTLSIGFNIKFIK